MSNEQWNDLDGKTAEQLKDIVRTLRTENSRLRDERNGLTEEMTKHVERFNELRQKFATLRDEVDLLVKRAKP